MHVVSSAPGMHDDAGEAAPSAHTALLGGSSKDQRGHYLALPTGIYPMYEW